MQTSSISLFVLHSLMHPFCFRILQLLTKAGLSPPWIPSLRGHQPHYHSFCPGLWLSPMASSPWPADTRSPLCLNRNTKPHRRQALPDPASALKLYPRLPPSFSRGVHESHLSACPPVSSQPIAAWLPCDTLHHQVLSGHPATCFHRSVSEKHHPGEKLWLSSIGWSFFWDLGNSLLVCGLEYILSEATSHLSSMKPQFSAAQAKGSGC